MKCPQCGHENREAAKFCRECAASLTQPRSCPACGAAAEPGQKFCDECGVPITDAPSAASPARSNANLINVAARNPLSYTPKHLADRILQSRSALEGERKQVTVLFADVKGSMELAEQLDPEAWHSILERFFAILTEGVHRFEGTVNQYTGDGIMALFGAPIAHEDHAQRACYAALHLREALREFARDIRRTHGLDFSTRMGLNSGDVIVGRIGDDLRMDYTAQGHTVGLAQRMENLAEPNACFMTAATAALVGGYFALDDLGEVRLKGATEPVHVHQLTGIGPLRTRFDVSRARGLSPFVGRDADMQTLESALEAARAGNGQVVGIVAEAGTGKSRLCFEFLERCKARGLSTQVGHALAHGRNIPLVPMLEVFRAYFGITDGDADRLVRDKIAGRLLLMDEQFRALLAVVFDFFGVADLTLPMPRMDAETRQRQLFAVLRKTVQEERAEGQPVTLIEDLHWIDSASEAFLDQWVEAVAGSHALLILNFRPEYHAAWMNRSWYRQIPLAPLGPEALRALLAELLGNDVSTAGLAATIHQRSGGNPFFTEEIVQTLIESGSLVGTRGNYRLVTPIEQLQVPATVQALLSARIDRLGEGEKQVLQAASVIGKDFTAPVLKRVLDDMDTTPTTDLPSALHTLREGEFILEQSLYPVAEYTFKHPLTQEVALHSQLQERRKRTHAAIARALVVTHADRLDEHASLVAHHHDAAGEIVSAARWHRRAAEWAGMKDVQTAVRHWMRARELARQMGDGPEASVLMVAACLGAITIGGWRMGGTIEQWTTVFEEGCAAAERALDLTALAGLNMNFGVLRGLGPGGVATEYVRYTTKALQISEAARSHRPLHCAALTFSALAHCWTGQLREVVSLADRVIEFAQGDIHLGIEYSGFSPLLTAGLTRAHAIGFMHDPDTALREFSALRQQAIDSGNPEQTIWSTFMEAELRCALDRGDGMRSLAQIAARAAENRELGAEIGARVTMVATLHSEREWRSLVDAAEDTLRLLREGSALQCWEATFRTHLSTGRLMLGEPGAARVAAAEAVSGIRRGQACWTPGCYAALARAQLALDEPAPEIVGTLDEYADLLTRSGFALLEGELHELRAQLAQREGLRGEEVAALRRAHTGYVRFGMTTQAARVQALIDAESIAG